jgi:hypothetical protein
VVADVVDSVLSAEVLYVDDDWAVNADVDDANNNVIRPISDTMRIQDRHDDDDGGLKDDNMTVLTLLLDGFGGFRFLLSALFIELLRVEEEEGVFIMMFRLHFF